MRLFGTERLIGMFNAMRVPEGQEIEHKMLTNAIESAQKKIENNNFGIRKNLLEYDRVMSEQREIIYEERLRVLNGESMRDFIYKMITDITENCVDISINEDAEVDEWNFNELNTLLIPTIPLEPVTAERVRCDTGAHEPQIYDRGIREELRASAGGLWASGDHDGCDRGLSGGKRRGV